MIPALLPEALTGLARRFTAGRVVIRSGRPEDAPACAAILNDWIDRTPWMPRCHSRDLVERHIRHTVLARRQTLIAERAARPCGFLAVDPAEAMVTALYVDHASQNEGLGTRLVEAAKARWPDGLRLWVFVANIGARRFYERHGFRQIDQSDGDNEEGLPDLLYQWRPV